MSAAIDLTGFKFGMLTVLKRNGSNEHGKAVWLCRCDCGKESVVISSSLKSGKTKSCGCQQTAKSQFKNGNKLGEAKREDLKGVKINGIEFLNYLKSINQNAVWLLKCHCGNEFECLAASVKSGNTTSCGCLAQALKNEKRKQRALENGNFLGIQKSGNGFSAFFRKNKQRIYLGQFATKTEAAKAYDKAAKEYYGVNAVLNFPDMSEFEE